jgi:hypothetical protein
VGLAVLGDGSAAELYRFLQDEDILGLETQQLHIIIRVEERRNREWGELKQQSKGSAIPI